MQGSSAQINGVSIWYLKEGEGIPVVLVHGGPGSYDYLEPLYELLKQPGYQFIRYEQRGSWRSEKQGPYTIETFVEDLEKLRIQLGFEKWVVCGHSWGASLGLAYTVQHSSRVRALIYISGTGLNPAWHADYRINRLQAMSKEDREEYTNLRSIVDTLHGEDKLRIRKRLRELSLQTDVFHPENISKLPRSDEPFINSDVNLIVGLECREYFESGNLEVELSKLTTPSLIVHGEADPRSYRYAAELADLLQNSMWVKISEAGHYPWLDNPLELNTQIHDFLAKLG